jgi:hypothetical protein
MEVERGLAGDAAARERGQLALTDVGGTPGAQLGVEDDRGRRVAGASRRQASRSHPGAIGQGPPALDLGEEQGAVAVLIAPNAHRSIVLRRSRARQAGDSRAAGG